jgi:hypothetical protein
MIVRAIAGIETALNVGVISMTFAAAALGFGMEVFWPLLRRRFHTWLSLTFLVLAALSVAGIVGRRYYLEGAPALGDISLFWIVFVASFGWITAAGLRRQWADRKVMGSLEFSFPRPGAREASWIVNIQYVISVLIVALSLRPRGSAGCCYAVVVAFGAFVLSCSARPVELRAGGIKYAGFLYPWAKLGRFEWMPGNQTTLRINRDSSNDIRVTWPEDPAIEVILTSHGLIRY